MNFETMIKKTVMDSLGETYPEASPIKEYIQRALVELDAFRAAQAQGRLIMLPVSVDNTCWVKRISDVTTIVEGVVKGVTFLVDSLEERMIMSPENVFASREEAENALLKGNEMKARIWPYTNGDKGFVCMPLASNISDVEEVQERHPDWCLVRCPECGEDCWESEIARSVIDGENVIGLCTQCSLRKGQAAP